MKFEKIRLAAFEANMAIKESGLVLFTWGNVSVIDRKQGVVAIKPSGVAYETLKVEDIVIVDYKGKIIDGKLKPSVDLPTHLKIYASFNEVESIVHTHSTYATAWAQKNMAIPLLGTTHADYFSQEIPCVRYLEANEMANYESSTGKAIVDKFKDLNYMHVPGCIVAGHGVFAWGSSSKLSIYHATVLEQIAKIAYITVTIPGEHKTLPDHMTQTHFNRKHGKNKTYGQ